MVPRHLELLVTGGNETALRLYQRMGFSEYGREMKVLKQDGRYFDEILMVGFLASSQATCQKRM